MLQLVFAAFACVFVLVDGDGKDLDETRDSRPEQELANLGAFVGTWELTVEGIEEKGTSEVRSILGGRFITEDVKIPFENFHMEWHGVLGYDRVKKQYTGVWFDNMANVTRSDTGEADATGRVLSFRGEHAGNAKFLWRISNNGNKTMTIEMFEVAEDGTETPVLKVRGEKKE